MRRAPSGCLRGRAAIPASAVRRIRTAPLGSFITRGAMPLLAPAVEGGARHPQLSDDLLDRSAAHPPRLPPCVAAGQPAVQAGWCMSVPAACPCGAGACTLGPGAMVKSTRRHATGHARGPARRPPAYGPVCRCVRARGRPGIQGRRAGPGPCDRAAPGSGPGTGQRHGVVHRHAGRPAARAAPHGRPDTGKRGLDVLGGVGRGSASVHDRPGRPPRADCPCGAGTSTSPNRGGA